MRLARFDRSKLEDNQSVSGCARSGRVQDRIRFFTEFVSAQDRNATKANELISGLS